MRLRFARHMVRATAGVAVMIAGSAHADLRPDMGPVAIGNIGQWFGPDDYPKEAMRARRQGRVIAALKLDATGAIVGCTIEQSSGTTILDTATCQIATAHLRFDPATDHQGHPTDSVYRLPVRWVLPDTVPQAVDVTAAPPPDTVVEIAFTYDAGGVLRSCHVDVAVTPGVTVDQCAAAVPGTPTPYRWRRNGRPVGATIVRRYSEHIIVAP